MGRSGFTRPKKSSEVRRRTAKRKFRNRFLRLIGNLKIFRPLLQIFSGSVLAWVVLILTGGFVIFATTSNYFHLKKVTIEREDAFLDTEKVKISLEDFYDQNLLFIHKNELQNFLLTEFPDFRTVKITEKWPNEIKLTITTSPPVFNVFNHETANFSILSTDGVILKTTIDDGLPILKLFQYDKILTARNKLTNHETIEKILLIQHLVTDQLKLEIQNLHFLFLARELHVISQGEMALWIDLQADIPAQIKKLNLSVDKIGLYRKSFEHIDLRIPNQLFWKER